MRLGQIELLAWLLGFQDSIAQHQYSLHNELEFQSKFDGFNQPFELGPGITSFIPSCPTWSSTPNRHQTLSAPRFFRTFQWEDWFLASDAAVHWRMNRKSLPRLAKAES